MLHVFTTARNALQALTGIEHVARLTNQLQPLEEGQTPSYPRPAAFISFADVTYATQHYGTQVGSGTLEIYLVQTIATTTDEAFFTLRDAVHKALQGIQATPDVGPFNRIAEAPGPVLDGLAVWALRYDVSWNDDTAATPFTLHNLTDLSVTHE